SHYICKGRAWLNNLARLLKVIEHVRRWRSDPQRSGKEGNLSGSAVSALVGKHVGGAQAGVIRISGRDHWCNRALRHGEKRRIGRNHRYIRFHDHAVAPYSLIYIRPIGSARRIAGADRPRGQYRYQNVFYVRAQKRVREGPQTKRAWNSRIKQYIIPA